MGDSSIVLRSLSRRRPPTSTMLRCLPTCSRTKKSSPGPSHAGWCTEDGVAPLWQILRRNHTLLSRSLHHRPHKCPIDLCRSPNPGQRISNIDDPDLALSVVFRLLVRVELVHRLVRASSFAYVWGEATERFLGECVVGDCGALVTIVLSCGVAVQVF